MLPREIDYNQIGSLSTEVRQRLIKERPETLGDASRLPGITPAAVTAVLAHVKKKSFT